MIDDAFIWNIKSKRYEVMKLILKYYALISVLALSGVETIEAQNKKATVREVEKMLLTYSYSSPREYADFGRLYPYHRFDGYSSKGEMKAWKMIELENDYIKLWVAPDIGGKIWGAVDKKTGKEFLYYNHVVKFRDVSSRGPWTSGGLEMNFGIIGHAPWCSSAVDYKIKQDDSGNALCIIGGTDVSLGTDWRVQIILPAESAYVETRVLWYNGTSSEKPFYQWMNAGIKTEGDLQYYFPGNTYLTHDGKAKPWPMEQGHRIDCYEENNFGHYKSYHVLGNNADFWGTYWHRDDFGLAHYSPKEDKLGKKIWIWGLSRYGMVWEDLLTDKDGQYSEVQSGKLFNQSIGTSYKTPFKHMSMKPGTVYEWSEYWFPYQQIGGLSFANPQLAYHIQPEQRTIKVYAVSPLDGKLEIRTGEGVSVDYAVHLNPTEIKECKLPEKWNESDYRVYWNGGLLYDTSLQETPTNRPMELSAAFNHQSAYGLYLQAREFGRQNFGERAVLLYQQSLALEPYFVPSLNELAEIYIESNRLQEADSLLRKALSVDTYNAQANFNFARIAEIEMRLADAIDAYSVAMQSGTYQGLAARHLALLYYKKGDKASATRLLEKCIQSSSLDLKACMQLAVVKQEDAKKRLALLDYVLDKDPLNYIANYERVRMNREVARHNLQQKRNEYSYDTVLRIADFYQELGMNNETTFILESVAHTHPLLLYRLAWLYHMEGEEDKALDYIKKSEDLPASLVYPHGAQEECCLRWVCSTHLSAWKADYYLALLYLSMNRNKEATSYMQALAGKPDFYAFYLTRALQVSHEESDYLRALQLAPEQYVCYLELGKHYLQQKRPDKTVALLEGYRKKDQGNSYINLLLANAYSIARHPQDAVRLLEGIVILPNEGSLAGRNIWREANLNCAIQMIKSGQYRAALKQIRMARLWPENLGVGKPYQAMVDERMEDLLVWYISYLQKRPDQEVLEKIAFDNVFREANSVMNVYTLIALRNLGKSTEATEMWKQLQSFCSGLLPNRWCEAIWNNRYTDAEAIIQTPFVQPDALPFEVLFEDRDYILIRDNYDFFKRILSVFIYC